MADPASTALGDGRHASDFRPGYYRVLWSVDLPKGEFTSPDDAARQACARAGERDALGNVFVVCDGDSGRVTEHDLGC